MKRIIFILLFIWFAVNAYADASDLGEQRIANAEHDLTTSSKTINLIAPRSLSTGQVAINTASVAKVIGSSQNVLSVALTAHQDGLLWGNSSVTLSTGKRLESGDTTIIDIDNVSDIYVISAYIPTTGDISASWVGVIK